MADERPLQKPVTIAFDGRLDVLWEASFKGKPSAPLSLEGGVLSVPSSRGRMAFFDWATGDRLGRIRPKGLVQTSLAQADTLGLMAVGPPKNRVVAYDLLRNRELWRQSLVDAAPTIAVADDRGVAASTGGLLTALSLDSGESLWVFEDSGHFVAAPVVHNGIVFQPDDAGRLFAVSLEDGSELYRVDLDAPIVNSVVADEIVAVTTVTGRVAALDPADGRLIWEADLDEENWTSPAVANGVVVTVLSRGVVVALNAGDGSERWRFDTEQAVRATPLIVDQVVVVATLGGRVYSLRLDSGLEIARREFSAGIPFAPVSDGHRVAVATRDGDLICLGDSRTIR